MSRLFAVLILLTFGSVQAAPGLAVNGVRLWSAPDSTRLVFDTSGPAQHRVFELHAPERLVVDIPGAIITTATRDSLPSGGVVQSIRSARKDETDLRIVIDLTESVKAKSFALKPNRQYGHRLVIDLENRNTHSSVSASNVTIADFPSPRELVIAIDAGHGGEDSGARGKRGTREKDVVLSISRKLAAVVNRQPGMRAVLTRDGDYFLPLRKRMHKARAANADMFISIHADAFHDRRARGSSVFVLSRRGATSEMARWLAARENASDLVGGVSLDDKDAVLKEVLLDLAQTATLSSSVEAAEHVFKEMKRLGKTHKKRVQKAGFMVLKSPDIPSMLVETAFISNPTEEKRLRSSVHQQKIAMAIMNGIRAYFSANPLPEGIRMASFAPEKHVVKRGDTLSHIAQRYGVSLKALRDTNNIKGNRLPVGKALKVPGSNPFVAQPESQSVTQVAQAVPQTYKVKNGDTLGKIAQRFGVSLKALRKANGIKGNRLLVGKVVKIPGASLLVPQVETQLAEAAPQKYKVKNGDTLGKIAQRFGVSLKALRKANGIKGNRLLVDKVVKIPGASLPVSQVETQLAEAAPQLYKVKNGDTLGKIAQRFGVSLKALREANGIKGNRLLVGKVVKIPGASLPVPQVETQLATAVPQKYKVKNGDSLSYIAQRHGVSMKAIRAVNNIKGNRLLAGKVLKIPAADSSIQVAAIKVAQASQLKHKVRNGETLSHIAVRYGVTQRAIRSANKIRGDRLLIGKMLTIPAQDS